MIFQPTALLSMPKCLLLSSLLIETLHLLMAIFLKICIRGAWVVVNMQISQALALTSQLQSLGTGPGKPGLSLPLDDGAHRGSAPRLTFHTSVHFPQRSQPISVSCLRTLCHLQPVPHRSGSDDVCTSPTLSLVCGLSPQIQ